MGEFGNWLKSDLGLFRQLFLDDDEDDFFLEIGAVVVVVVVVGVGGSVGGSVLVVVVKWGGLIRIRMLLLVELAKLRE